ncbi:hypothetical protein DKX38_019596 [Salix brachista]|uniref:S1 motif domain-containing protein n=1 Tax=Salix brachista TaxID=2182728 RepID=A0A5N5KGQ4_9ROSI|nr:hypothetical protein DKX38_019596 [Salix brachista]
MQEEGEMVTPGEVLGKAAELKAGKGAYIGSYRDTDLQYVFSSLTGLRRTVSPSPDSPDQRPTVEVTGHKAHGAVPEPGSVVIARVTKVMAKTASADIMCVGPKSVRDKFTGIIRQQDVRSTEIDKVDMHLSFRPGDIIRALVVSLMLELSLGDARAYYLSTAKNELGVVSAESAAGATLVPISWTEMQCPLTGQIEQRKVAKDCFDLPPDYFQQLPSDLRLDLNDAAFDLSNGSVLDECGKELGEILLNLSRAWELAFGKRLISSGRRFQSMGQYGQGELQKIAQTMITSGKLLSASSMPMETDKESKKETRVFKFGELQVEITPQKANIGAVIGLVFGILSWELAQGIQSIPESSLEYANDNALLLAKSLRVALLAVCFSSAFLSACTTVALFLLARQLKSEED